MGLLLNVCVCVCVCVDVWIAARSATDAKKVKRRMHVPTPSYVDEFKHSYMHKCSGFEC